MLYPGGYGGFIGAQALVYQMLLHTRPSSIVEWPNKEGESRSFYDMCVKDVEDTRPHHACQRSGDDQAAAPVMEEGRRAVRERMRAQVAKRVANPFWQLTS